MSKKSINNLKVDEQLIKFVNEEAIPGTNINIDNFWNGFDKAVHELAPINKKLINKRDEIQKKIDEWHLSNKGTTFDKSKYYNFLKSINYIVEEKADFKITTSNVDNEIATIAGPQLVVPVDNSRYALNAANARWGSLYDALYGTDVIPGEKGKGYNAERGNKVRNYVRKFLDDVVPLSELKWHEITKIQIEDDKLVFFSKDKKYYLKNNNQFIGFNGEKNRPNSILIKNNNLHIEILIDPNHLIGKEDLANICDVIIESAVSTIVDNEDSVTAVDAKDKVKCYRNWLGLMKGTLQAEIQKNGKKFTRK